MKPFSLRQLAWKLDDLGLEDITDDPRTVANVAEAVLEAAGLDWSIQDNRHEGFIYHPQTPEHRAAGWQFLGVCGVDTGALMVGDPCYFFGEDCEAQRKGTWGQVLAEAYDPRCGDFRQPGGAAALTFPHGHAGLAVLVGVDGDGIYAVEARRNAHGQVVEVRFFTGFEDEGEQAKVPDTTEGGAP